MSQTDIVARSRYWEDVSEGEELPPLELDLTTTMIIAGAIGTRDFYPLHHDRDFAQSQGFKDIVLNLMTSGGYAARLVTDWSGPEGEIKKLVQRVAIPAHPGDKLIWNGKVISKRIEGNEHLVDVEYAGRVAAGVHCSGTFTLALPSRSSSH